MNGIFIVTKREQVMNVKSQRDPNLSYPACNIILRTADNAYGDAFLVRLKGDQTKLPINEGDTVLAGISLYCSEKDGKYFQNINVNAIKKI